MITKVRWSLCAVSGQRAPNCRRRFALAKIGLTRPKIYFVPRACMRLFVCVRVGLFIIGGLLRGRPSLVFISPLDLNFINMSAKDSIKSAYQKAIDLGVNTGNSSIASKKNPIVIGGQDYGPKWNDQDAAAFNLHMAELGFQNELALLDYENEYNSPSEQAKRLRAAGINPDLVGVEGHASADADQANPNSSGGSPTMSPLQVFQETSSIFSSAQSSIHNALNTFVQLKQGFNAIDKQEIDITKDQISLARDLFKMYGGAQNNETTADGSGNFTSNIHALGWRSKRQYNRWVRRVNTLWNDLVTGHAPDFGTRSAAVGDEVKYNDERVKRATAPLSSSDYETDLAGTFNNIRKLVRDTLIYQKRFLRSFEYNRMRFQQEFDPKADALAQNEKNKFDANMNHGRNLNYSDYISSEVATKRAETAMAEYRAAYEKAMKDLLYNNGIIGMTTAINMAGSSGNPLYSWLNSLANYQVFN